MEEWTKTTFKKKIFDSYLHDYKINTSEFDNYIFGKEKIAILLEDVDNNLFGLFIDSKIMTYRYGRNGQWSRQDVKDPKCFIFSLNSCGRSKEMVKINIKKEESNFSFSLYEKHDKALFSTGIQNDICIMNR